MDQDTQSLRETDRKYVKFKMKRIKKATKRGNRVEAQRHATELKQYFGMGQGSETPIEQNLDAVTRTSGENKNNNKSGDS